jgi:L-amino acid N-acyltransferase YncA
MDRALKRQPLVLRDSAEADLPRIQAIYAHHVATGLGSFEESPPDLAEMTRRWRAAQGLRLPYLVAEVDGVVCGYAYVAPYRPRSAYRYTVEDSIYVDPQSLRRGVARALLEELIARCTALGYRQMVAVIGDTGNTPSIQLHARCGFRQAGTLTAVGRKFGRWVDTVMMQRALGPGDGPLEPR